MNLSQYQIRSLLRAAGCFIAYLLMAFFAHALLYTIVTTIVSAADKKGIEFGTTINEIASQYLFFAYACGSLVVTIMLWKGTRSFYSKRHFWSRPNKNIFQLDKNSKNEFIRGISTGFVIPLALLLSFYFAGHISYLGVYINSALGTPLFPLFLLTLISLPVLLWCEEYIFRFRIQSNLNEVFPPFASVLLTALMQTFIRNLQFQISYIDILNLLLFHITLGLFYERSQKPHRGLGLQLTALTLLHCGFGLPLWSIESPSFFLMKPTVHAYSILSGGEMGPISSLGFTAILAVLLVSSFHLWKIEKEAERKKSY
ncbi:MAG: hypothetical protein M9962_11640 [Oligoflexia bacterium]|nr:hypothetical protein [Oligoflexia bacterium]